MNKLLVVEDSKAFTELLKKNISVSCDYSINICHSFSACKALLENELDFFAAILDLNLPDAPNGEVVDYVLKKNIPSIVLTGNLNDEIRDKILARPVVDYLLKSNFTEIDRAIKLLHRLKKNPNIKILVVEDSKSFREYIVNLLEIQGFEVLQAGDGHEAMKLLKKQRNNIWMVLTDYNMPNMDGLALTETIRKSFAPSQLSVIAMSSATTPHLSVKFLKLGANDTLTKPFLVEEFYSRVNNHIELMEYVKQMENKATRDQLTGLHNRGYLFEVGQQVFTKARTNQLPLAVGILDIDLFKNVNDTYGHEVGDLALINVANLFKKHCHKHDIVIRLGGEEFCFLISSSNNPEVYFEMLRRSIETMELPLQNGGKLKITASIGIAYELGETLENTLHTADMALYQAKEQGRNRIVISNEAKPEGLDTSTKLRPQRS